MTLRAAILSSALFFHSSLSWAYLDVLDTGEIIPEQTYKMTTGLQALTDRGGINLDARFDVGFREEFGGRVLVGFGKTDYYFGGLFKWIPVPDIEGQPAIGFNLGLIYARDGNLQDLTFRFEPLISKRFTLDGAYLTPYASIPIGIRNRDSSNRQVDQTTRVAGQVVVGSQLQVEKWSKLQFIAEVGADLNHALSHISVAAILYFDESGI
jgi:hypothetical protein